MAKSLDSFNARRTLEAGGRTYDYFSLPAAEANGLGSIGKLPFSLKVVLENLLRFEDGRTVTREDILAVATWSGAQRSAHEIAFRPARVLMQDFTGVPAVVDLAAMRDAARRLGGDADRINPQIPVDLVIDHSVMVDYFGTTGSFARNVAREFERNGERYAFLRWGSKAFRNFRAVPPGTGICHQVNLEYLARTVFSAPDEEGRMIAYPDTLVGTDSHTTMVNALSVLGWGVGGIEAEAAMLGQPLSMILPEIIGFRLTGKLAEGVTATDLVLRIVEMLRQKGVVGKFVEFCGEGLDNLSLEDAATIANMAPEYGATCGFFPIDSDTLAYLEATGRDASHIALVRAYAQAQGLMREPGTSEPDFSDMLELDLASVRPSLAGPKRPQDRVDLDRAHSHFGEILASEFAIDDKARATRHPIAARGHDLGNGDVVIASITSCTNTSNPQVLIAAGLVARNARARGLQVKPWVKTSLAPGSKVVTEYLKKSGLQDDLDALGFNLVGYGCTTCIGNSGPLDEDISRTIAEADLVACSVLSGNRNFEGRINPDVRANYLASPALVVAYALAGSMLVDVAHDALGVDRNGNPVYLRDIWPANAEVTRLVRESITREMFADNYRDVFAGDERWQAISVEGEPTYTWPTGSTYVRNPPYFDDISMEPQPVCDIENAAILGLFSDSITTDHISPAGAIKSDSPAGTWLRERQIAPVDFNSFGARRGNHEIMMRGTFGNIRIKNRMLDGVEGGFTRMRGHSEKMSIYDAAMAYRAQGVPLVVFAGKEYGTGSSRDWAAKGTRLLGVRAVIAQSFERIHRSNLVGMGVIPFTFAGEESWKSLGLSGDETVSIAGLADIEPRKTMKMCIAYTDGHNAEIDVLCRIDTGDELDYVRAGGILHHVLRRLVAA